MTAAAEVYDWPARKAMVKEWLPLTVDEKQQFVGVYTANLEGTVYEIKVVINGEGLDISSSSSPISDGFFLTEREDNTATCTGGSGLTVNFSKDEKGQPIITALGSVFTQGADD